jgi:hypothetical protein
MYTKNLFLVLAASCFAFQPGIAPPAHAMLPVGDLANRNFYKNQDFIWETNKTDSSVGDGSAAPAVASPQEVTSKLSRPVGTEVATPPPHSGEEVAFLFPPPPRSGQEVAFLFRPRARAKT